MSRQMIAHSQEHQQEPRRAIVTGAVDGQPAVFDLMGARQWQAVQSISETRGSYEARLADGSRVAIAPDVAAYLRTIGTVEQFWSAGCYRNWVLRGA